jgi:hypothetical protein
VSLQRPIGVLLAMVAAVTPGTVVGAERGAASRPALRDGGVSRERHCHDGAYPRVRCFATARMRDADAASVIASRPSSRTSDVGLAGAYYVTIYEHRDYGGSSLMLSQSHADLRDIGWNDAISSFRSAADGRPKWWNDVGYAGTSWHWSTGAQVSFVGSTANDRFSSVRNVP